MDSKHHLRSYRLFLLSQGTQLTNSSST
jgi:hypothetical protein